MIIKDNFCKHLKIFKKNRFMIKNKKKDNFEQIRIKPKIVLIKLYVVSFHIFISFELVVIKYPFL